MRRRECCASRVHDYGARTRTTISSCYSARPLCSTRRQAEPIRKEALHGFAVSNRARQHRSLGRLSIKPIDRCGPSCARLELDVALLRGDGFNELRIPSIDWRRKRPPEHHIDRLGPPWSGSSGPRVRACCSDWAISA
ncbi:hypothetical protein [Lysobacter gummosus]|uniref:hypothetical protein n=1 Tax=Lysobacter gummosus TaxID=262324 RepID=UPI00363CA4E6